MRLRTKYALILLSILVVLGTLVVGSAELFKQQTVEQEQSELNNTAQVAAGQIDEAVADLEDRVRRRGNDLQQQEELDKDGHLGELVDRDDIFAVMVIDKNGTITEFRGAVEDENRTENIGKSVEEVTPPEEELWLQARTGTRIGQTFPIDENSSLMTIGTAILNESGKTEGAVLVGVVEIRNTDFFSAIEPLRTNTRRTRVTYTTGDGDQKPLQEQQNDFDETLEATATVPSTGWTLTVERDRKDLTDQIQFLQFIQFGSLFVVLLSVFGLGYYQYRTTLQQTDQLLDGFDELTQGNFAYKLDLEAAEEWNQIGEGFNTMAGDLEERERQIRERERRLSVLNRVLRHNLQNDLTVVQGYAEVLPTMDSETQREQASEKILEKSRGLVQHGKKARRLETVMENAEEGTTKLDIGGDIVDTLESYSEEYPEFTVEHEGPDEAWVDAVSGIEFGIEQLVENAFDHNESDDPRVRVSVERDEENVVVTVEDNGPGIPEHEWNVLVQDEETSLEHGSGIGLWLAYWAVVKSNGELEFGDQSEGGHVTARIPACEDPPENAGGDLLDS